MKKAIIVIVVLLLIGGGVALYMRAQAKKQPEKPAGDNAANPAAKTPPTR